MSRYYLNERVVPVMAVIVTDALKGLAMMAGILSVVIFLSLFFPDLLSKL